MVPVPCFVSSSSLLCDHLTRGLVFSESRHRHHRIIGTGKEESVGVGVPFRYDVGVVLSPWDVPSWDVPERGRVDRRPTFGEP